jgi:hypothetical protein
VDPSKSDNDYLLDYSDSNLDNLEHIYVEADPDYNHYKIILRFSGDESQQLSALSQRYGFAWNVSEPEDNDSIFWYDLNADGIVDDLDFTIMLNNLAESTKSSESYVVGDIKPVDGVINSDDVEALLQEIRNKRRADWHIMQEKPG